MESSDDDGVIFEGSPLYNSLVNSGSLASEIQTETWTLQHGQPEGNQNFHEYAKKESSTDGFWSFLNWCYQKIMSLCTHEFAAAERDFKQSIIQKLYSCKTLEEDDADFVRWYIQKPPTSLKCTWNPVHSHMFVIFTVPVLCFHGCCTIFALDIMSSFRPWSDIFTAVLALVLCIHGLRYVSVVVHKWRCRRHADIVDALLRSNGLFMNWLKKCLRLVQERELISRGFTLTSQRNPISQIEAGSSSTVNRQLPTLRKLVFSTAKEAVVKFREYTRNMIDNYPFNAELDTKNNYLAYESIQSYGPCLQSSVHDDDLFALTDGFSISALKGISHLASLHQSEFLKGLVLVHYQECDSRVQDLTFLQRLLTNVKEQLDAWSVSLQKSYDFHSYLWVSEASPKNKTQPISNMEDIYVAVHSLDLHLQAALDRVRSISRLLEHEIDGDHDEQAIKSYDLISMMQPIKAEIKSCEGCWEEGIYRIEKKSRSDTDKTSFGDSSAIQSDKEDVAMTTRCAPAVEDYIIEDQVFEGYTDPTEIPENYGWDKPLTVEEKEKKKREKLEALQMLSELKTVISVRAVNTEKREQAALLKKYPDLKFPDLENNSAFKGLLDKKCIGLEEDGSVNVTVSALNMDCEQLDEHTKMRETNEQVEMIADSGDERDINQSLITTQCRNTSCVSRKGVRCLRKRNLLELSDSNDEDDNKIGDGPNVALHSKPVVETCISRLHEQEDSDDKNCDIHDLDEDDQVSVSVPASDLASRMHAMVTGVNFGFTADIAAQAISRSKLMGVLKETTFGDVFGESSDEVDNDSNEL